MVWVRASYRKGPLSAERSAGAVSSKMSVSVRASCLKLQRYPNLH